MAQSLTLQEKIIGKSRAMGKFLVLMLRFIMHPGDFIRMYQREAVVADSVLDVAMISLEREFNEQITALTARVAQLEEQLRATSGSTE